ncbi:unnamed protein product [Urochloa humidicola]
MPPPPPELMEDLVEEILLRFPPADPTSLLRAALVCRLWCRLITGAAFRRRFREFHRTPPILGFLCDPHREEDEEDDVAGDGSVEGVFVPTTTSFRPPLCEPFSGWRSWNSRHGRVLLHDYSTRYFRPSVWKPITDSWVALPEMPLDDPDSWTTAVLCAAATGNGTCDHLDCQDGPFIVVLVVTDKQDPDGMFSYVYSSESSKWSKRTTAKQQHPGDDISSNLINGNALVGDALYFVFEKNDRILKYDLRTREIMSLMKLPCYQGISLISGPFVELMAMEDGRLGFARLEGSRLCLWSRDDEDVGWALNKVTELEKLLPFDVSMDYIRLVGFAEGVNVIFVSVSDVVFTIDLNSSKVMEVYEGSITCVVPYMSFCTPGTN